VEHPAVEDAADREAADRATGPARGEATTSHVGLPGGQGGVGGPTDADGPTGAGGAETADAVGDAMQPGAFGPNDDDPPPPLDTPVSRETSDRRETHVFPVTPYDDQPSPYGPTPAPGPRPITAAELASDLSLEGADLSSTPLASEVRSTILQARQSVPRELPRPAETRVFVVANQKGGVGKTTSAVNMAAALAQHGMRVLIIDLDPQGNASTALGVDHSEGTPGVYEAISDGMPLADLVQECTDTPGLFCVPATIDLAGAEIELVSLVARESRLRRALDAHLERTRSDGEAYDFVFIDCPPSLGLLTVNALVAGREMLIPIQCEYYALEGVTQLLRNIELVRAHLNPQLDVSTVLLTMFDARTRLAAQVAEEVRAHFGDAVLQTAIPRSVRISEAPSYSQTVMTYDPASAGALSYLEAARELAHRAADGGTNPAEAQ